MTPSCSTERLKRQYLGTDTPFGTVRCIFDVDDFIFVEFEEGYAVCTYSEGSTTPLITSHGLMPLPGPWHILGSASGIRFIRSLLQK